MDPPSQDPYLQFLSSSLPLETEESPLQQLHIQHTPQHPIGAE